MKFLVANENVPGTANARKNALARLGLRQDNDYDYKYARRSLDQGIVYQYSPGVSYPLQLGLCCAPISSKYSGKLEFDNIIRRLELDWWELRPKVVEKLKQIAGYRIPKEMKIISRGDIRAASPSWTSDRTTLGPHLDSESELFAGLIYLKSPLDLSRGSDLILYELKDDCPERYISQQRRIPLKYLNPVKTIEYATNNAIFFINSPKSIHSVSARSGSRIDRRNINLSLECPPEYCIFSRQDYISNDVSRLSQYGQYRNIKEDEL